MYKTLERITSNVSRVLNRYSLRADSFVDISLPNGDDLRLYASEDGNYVSIAVKTHRRTGRLETESENSDFDDFTTQRESIETNNNDPLVVAKVRKRDANLIAFDSLVWTKVAFTAFHEEDQS